MSCLSCLQCWWFRVVCPTPCLDRYAFCPPFPETYEFIPLKDTKDQPQTQHRYKYRQLCKFCCKTGLGNFVPSEPFYVRSKSGNNLACLYISLKKKPEFVIFFCGANGSDLGIHAQTCFQLSAYLDCNVVTFDYSGYGISDGYPSHENVLLDAESVFEACRNKYGLRPEKMVVMGISLGSHPACHLAAKIDNIAGLILVSPIMSICRVFLPRRVTNCCDYFNNLDLIGKTNAKTLLLHGSHDALVSYEHSEQLYQQILLSNSASGSRYEQILFAAHSNVLEFESAWEKIVDFLLDLFPKYTHLLRTPTDDVINKERHTLQLLDSGCHLTASPADEFWSTVSLLTS